MTNAKPGVGPVLHIKGKSLLPIVQGGMGVGISAHGLAGHVARAGALGLPVYWSNRQRLEVPEGAAPPVADAPDLSALPGLLLPADR